MSDIPARGNRLLRFHLSQGPVELYFPSEMTPDDVQDFEGVFAILLRSLRRWHTVSAVLEDKP